MIQSGAAITVHYNMILHTSPMLTEVKYNTEFELKKKHPIPHPNRQAMKCQL